MGASESEEKKGTCFVIMGFGKKMDFEANKVFDLDKTYKNVIKPAIEEAGLKCIRADEIVHSGLIDIPMYEQLLNADVVVADLSTSNKNAFYELGIRHALRPHTTLIIAEDGIKTFPFDINHIAVRQYHHLGEDIGFDEVMRFRKLLTDSVKELLKQSPLAKDSPVYSLLQNLTPPAIAAVQAAIQENKSGPKDEVLPGEGAGAAHDEASKNLQTHSILMGQVDDAQKRGDWTTAKMLLSLIRQMAKDAVEMQKKQATVQTAIEAPEDSYLLQRLALATYKSKAPTEQQALIDASDVLKLLNPHTTNDTETLGQWGSVHKRLWQIDPQRKYLEEAINASERGFYVANDYYNGTNFAFLLNMRAAQAADAAEATADKVIAGRVRKKVLEICNTWLENNPMPASDQTSEKAMTEYLKNWYWVTATMGEAYVGLGDEANGERVLQEAYSKAPEGWMKASTEEQLGKLRALLKS